MALWLEDDQLTFRVQNFNSSRDAQAEISYTLGAAGRFYDILLTINVGDADTSLIQLFVDSTLRAEGNFYRKNKGPGDEKRALSDWAGSDRAELGSYAGGSEAGGGNGGQFQGDIAIMRFYQNDILDQSEIDGNFAALQAIPEPSSIAMWSALGIIGLVVARRKRKLTRAA